LIQSFESSSESIQERETPSMGHILVRGIDTHLGFGIPGILCGAVSHPEKIARFDLSECKRDDTDRGRRDETRIGGTADLLQPLRQCRDIGLLLGIGRSQQDELGGGHVIGRPARADRRPDRTSRLGHHVVQVGGTHDPHGIAELVRAGQIQQNGKPPLTGAVSGEVFEILDELDAVRQAAQRIDAAEGMLQFDLCHHHGGQVGQGRHLRLGCLSRFQAEHTHGSEAETVGGGQRRPCVEADALVSERTVTVPRVLEQIRNHHCAATLRHLSARCLVARHRPMIDPDAGLEPLPVEIGERDRRDRQSEDLSCHTGDAIEGLARGRVQQPELM